MCCDSSTERFQREVYDLTGTPPMPDPTPDSGGEMPSADPPSTTSGSGDNDNSSNTEESG